MMKHDSSCSQLLVMHVVYNFDYHSLSAASEEDKVSLHDGDLFNKPSQQENSMCLGCYPFSRFPFFVLNKRNCIRALQKDDHTCDFHKKLVAGQQFKDAKNNVFELMNIRHFDDEEPMSKEAKQSGSVYSSNINTVVPHLTNAKNCFSKEISSPISSVKVWRCYHFL